MKNIYDMTLHESYKSTLSRIGISYINGIDKSYIHVLLKGISYDSIYVLCTIILENQIPFIIKGRNINDTFYYTFDERYYSYYVPVYIFFTDMLTIENTKNIEKLTFMDLI